MTKTGQAYLFNYENGTPKSLSSFVTKLLRLLSRDCSTLIKRLQHSYQEIAALLSRDCSTLIKRLQHSYQEIATKHNKNDRILKFLPPMHFTHINFLPVHSSKKVSHSLKNGGRYHNLWVTL